MSGKLHQIWHARRHEQALQSRRLYQEVKGYSIFSRTDQAILALNQSAIHNHWHVLLHQCDHNQLLRLVDEAIFEGYLQFFPGLKSDWADAASQNIAFLCMPAGRNTS